MQMLSEDDLNIKELQRPANTQHSALIECNCLPLWVDQGDGGVVGSTKD